MMFFRTLKVALVTVLLLEGAGSASALTLDELEQCWGATRNQAGTFKQSNSDGTVLMGTFSITDPGQMQQKYNGGGQAKIEAQSLYIEDMREWKQYPLGVMGTIFRRNANFRAGAIKSTAATAAGGRTIFLADPKNNGDAWVEFNSSCHMIAWQWTVEGNTGRTRFKYKTPSPLPAQSPVPETSAARQSASVATQPVTSSLVVTLPSGKPGRLTGDVLTRYNRCQIIDNIRGEQPFRKKEGCPPK